MATSGGYGTASSSSRAGFLPVALAPVPPAAFKGIPLFLRAKSEDAPPDGDGSFTLYRGHDVTFTSADRARLLQHGVEFVYVRMADQARFRQQTEAQLEMLVTDPKVAISAKSAIIYETSVELINEVLADPDLARLSPRIEAVSRAVTTLVVNNPSAFSHLFATSHHDFYTATHMVNVATCMVPLAYALGHHDMEVLNQVCHAGLLHDIGKLYIPEAVLNKSERLSPEDWTIIKRHPEMACSHLADCDGIPETVLTVARQHHERLDGSGYPAGLRADQIHPFSKICAVVDSFDAMTALRPFKKRALTVSEALGTLKSETLQKYDADVVAAWIRLLGVNTDELPPPEARPAGRRAAAVSNEEGKYAQYRFNCPARLHVLDWKPQGWTERPGLQVIAHSISRSGLGVLSQVPVPVGARTHVYLHARAWNRDHVTAQTTRCRCYSDGWYEIGMQFVADDSAAETAEQ